FPPALALHPDRVSFYSSRHHPTLHSFPTRRSSDLERQIHCHVGRRAMARKPQGLAVMRAGKAGEREEGLTDIGLKSSKIVTQMRSEENTSELQSRRGNECRLVREKKNVLISIR